MVNTHCHKLKHNSTAPWKVTRKFNFKDEREIYGENTISDTTVLKKGPTSDSILVNCPKILIYFSCVWQTCGILMKTRVSCEKWFKLNYITWYDSVQWYNAPSSATGFEIINSNPSVSLERTIIKVKCYHCLIGVFRTPVPSIMPVFRNRQFTHSESHWIAINVNMTSWHYNVTWRQVFTTWKRRHIETVFVDTCNLWLTVYFYILL